MSLLLEALKKAEQAKQSGSGPDPESTLRGGEGLSLAPAEAPAPASPATGERSPITRDRLPEINPALEILTDDLPSASGGGREAPAGASQGGARGAPRGPAQPPRDEPDPRQAERDAARQLFEAKPADYDPRRPFKITLAALGVAAIGVIVYFWWQMQPRSLQVTQRPSEPPSTQIAAAPPPAPPPTAPPAASTVAPPAASAVEPPAALASAAAPATPAEQVPVPPQPMAAAQPAPAVAAPRAAPSVQIRRPSQPPRAPSREPTAAAPRPDAGIEITRSASVINQALSAGYAAFQSGDMATAHREYERALAADRRNRDALLGLAAIDIHSGSYSRAEAYYLKVLELDPRDPDANAGLVSLRGRADPVQSESQLKTLIASEPNAAPLHFMLGNQLAAQSRWAEAQQAYFRAAAIEPENPDYAFNLAVSLDHMRQVKPALEHYQRALALAGSRVASFDKPQVETRIRELQR
ncbi:MAG: tetratricopeptide repeat protein [Burkholderiales bacterium]|nr:tetratricopeptide repeat protein [Burkholderiales bacterium]